MGYYNNIRECYVRDADEVLPPPFTKKDLGKLVLRFAVVFIVLQWLGVLGAALGLY